MQVGVALVVGRATAVDAAVLDGRLERRRVPQVERIDRLDVVVGVDEDRRRAFGMQPVGVDDRMAAGVGETSTFSKPIFRRRSARNSAAACVSASCSWSVPMLGMRRRSR